MLIKEEQAKKICEKFFSYKHWRFIDYENHSKMGLNPLLVQQDDNIHIFLFDNYTSILDNAMETIKQDLEKNGGYTDSFYLDLEDMDMLGLYDSFEKDLVERDKEAYLEDVKSVDTDMSM